MLSNSYDSTTAISAKYKLALFQINFALSLIAPTFNNVMQCYRTANTSEDRLSVRTSRIVRNYHVTHLSILSRLCRNIEWDVAAKACVREAERRIQPSNIFTSLGKLEQFEKICLPGSQNMAMFSQDKCVCVGLCVYVFVCLSRAQIGEALHCSLRRTLVNFEPNKLVINCQFPRGVASSLSTTVSRKRNRTIVDSVRPRWSTQEGWREWAHAIRRQPGGSN